MGLAPPPSQERRSELTDFLRNRRAQVTPRDVGLPANGRRRTPGLRREEVAQLAGVGVTWYTWLEQGRPINASVQVLDAIARTLRLDRTECEHLYRLADLPWVSVPESGHALEPETQAILDALNPLPAAAYSSRYDLLAHNRAYRAMFPWSSCAEWCGRRQGSDPTAGKAPPSSRGQTRGSPPAPSGRRWPPSGR